MTVEVTASMNAQGKKRQDTVDTAVRFIEKKIQEALEEMDGVTDITVHTPYAEDRAL